MRTIARKIPNVNINEKRYPVAEAAPLLGKAPKTLRAWIATGKIGVCRVGHHVLVPEGEIQRILNEGTVPATAEAA